MGVGEDYPLLSTSSSDSPLLLSEDDSKPIHGVRDFFGEFYVESKKLWYLAFPAIFTAACQYSLGAVTQISAGQIGTSELAAVAVENSIIAAFAYGILWGMGSALETLCGIGFGAGELEMLGIYMQRSWVILNSTALLVTFLYIFATPVLKFIGQTDKISEDAGAFALWMIPQLFAYAMNYPLVKFLQAQRKFVEMAVIAGAALVFHSFLSWLLIQKLGWGLAGVAVTLDASWWFIVVAQMFFVFSGGCGQAWNGFSWMAFQNLGGFLKLSLASALMIALDVWFSMSLTLFAGYLKNAELSVDASSICGNIMGWAATAGVGFNAAISVRVSNELGAIHPRATKFSAVVVGITSFLLGLSFMIILFMAGNHYPSFFSNDPEVQRLVYELTPLLGLAIFIQIFQPSLTGVAIGAGWQAYVACINIVCYYVLAVPLALLLAFKFNMGIKGIWVGLILGYVLEASVVLLTIVKTNWNKEACIAEDRLKQWGGETADGEI